MVAHFRRSLPQKKTEVPVDKNSGEKSLLRKLRPAALLCSLSFFNPLLAISIATLIVVLGSSRRFHVYPPPRCP